ncbi:MAG: hypothetical protein WAN65_00115 [Candidatus Sulfotelmatobacter sp.]
MLKYFRAMVRMAVRNVVLQSGREGIEEGLALLSRDLAKITAADAAKAEATLAGLGEPTPSSTQSIASEEQSQGSLQFADTEGEEQATPPIAPAPPIILPAPTANEQHLPRRSPGRPRKLPDGAQ